MKGMRLAATSSVPVVAYVAKRDYPESHNSFLTQHLVQSSADTGEGRRDRRMRMNNGCDIVSMPVDCKMHTDLASHLPVSTELSALKIDDDHVG